MGGGQPDLVIHKLHLQLSRAEHGLTVDPSEGAGLDHVSELVTNQELLLSAQLQEGQEELLVRPEDRGLVEVLETLQDVRDDLSLGHHGRFRRSQNGQIIVGGWLQGWLQLLGDIAAAQVVESLQLQGMLALRVLVTVTERRREGR